MFAILCVSSISIPNDFSSIVKFLIKDVLKALYPVSTSVRLRFENILENNVISLLATECQKNKTLFEDEL